MRFIRWPELEKRLGVSRVTVWRWEKDGLFPRRVAIGPNSKGWIDEEVDRWEIERAAERVAS